MPKENSVHLSGFIYKPVERTTKSGTIITTFGMKVYAGKGADGKSVYDFVNVKYFNHIMNNEGEKDVFGRLAVESWERDGVKHKNVIIVADRVLDLEQPKKKEPEQITTFDDDIPWG